MSESGMTKFKFDGPVSGLGAWLGSTFLAGKAEPFLKSGPAPAEPTVDGLTTLVGTTFGAFLADGSRCRFLFLHAPWCGHCTKAKPDVAKLAKRFAAADNVAIAMMDATENDSEVPVQSFPTIFIAPVGVTDPAGLVAYKGDRTRKGFEKGLKQDCGIEGLKAPKKDAAAAAADGKEDL
jgi:thiol-disulfide isomerase/thioredoxin